MSDLHVYYDYLDVYDDTYYTEKKGNEWKQHILNCYRFVYKGLKDKLDYDSPISFHLSVSLLDEVLVDAIIGMRKVTDSKNNSVEEPNTFKIAAYLSYWWLRHKPVYLHHPKGFRLEDAHIAREEWMDDAQYEAAEKQYCWQLKHINELVAVQIVSTYIFQFERVVCGGMTLETVKRKEGSKFSFSSFDEMKDEILGKLTYYFCYRAIAPKIIEHILEAYTFHPAWGLTGELWKKETHGHG